MDAMIPFMPKIQQLTPQKRASYQIVGVADDNLAKVKNDLKQKADAEAAAKAKTIRERPHGDRHQGNDQHGNSGDAETPKEQHAHAEDHNDALEYDSHGELEGEEHEGDNLDTWA